MIIKKKIKKKMIKKKKKKKKEEIKVEKYSNSNNQFQSNYNEENQKKFKVFNIYRQ